MIKSVFLLAALALSAACKAQPAAFPESWVGNWKGELSWYKTGATAPQKVAMTLRIHPAEPKGTYSWQLIYGAGGEDNRRYKLIPKDTAGIHWVVDEQNGILLDQYWVGEKLCGAFTVMNNTIINTYRMEKDRLLIEFYSIGTKPVTTSGDGTDEIPKVDSYRVGSYQQAVLTRQ